jgi:uncharacterized protein YkwD
LRTGRGIALGCLLALVMAVPARGCPDEQSDPNALTPGAARASLLCLINGERASRGLAPLIDEPHLDGAARWHSLAMRKHRFFDHHDVGRRIRRSGYTTGFRHWIYSEALHWGGAQRGRPLRTLRAFLASPIHRADVLSTRFHEIGIGVAIGSPLKGPAPDSAIYTVEFAARS